MTTQHEQVTVENRRELREWLAANHTQTDSIWLIRFKKHCGEKYVSYQDVVRESLCFGWIDSLPRKLDADRTMLRISPRKPGSGWSKVNKQYIEELSADGLMTAAGLAKIEAAKLDGSWSKLDGVDRLKVPDDLNAALEQYTNAKTNFNAFPPSTRRGILEWITNAKRAPTRAKRIAETARLAQDNVRANQWPRK